MPRGVKGTGPYSKYKEDASESSDKATAAKTTTRRRRGKAKTTRTTRQSTNGTARKPSITDLGTFRSVSVSSDGKLVLESKTGRKVEASFDRPSALLDLAEDAVAAADEYIANR